MQLVVESEVVELVLGSLLLLQVWWAAAGGLLVLQKPQILMNLQPRLPKIHHPLKKPQVLQKSRSQILLRLAKTHHHLKHWSD